MAPEAGGDGPPPIGLSKLPRVCLREAKADPVEPAFRQAHGLNALRPMCRIGCFLAHWFGRAHCRLCQALAFIAFRRDFHSSPPSYVGPGPPRSLPRFTLVSESGGPLKGIRNSGAGCQIFGSCPSSRHLHQLIRARRDRPRSFPRGLQHGARGPGLETSRPPLSRRPIEGLGKREKPQAPSNGARERHVLQARGDRGLVAH